MAAREDVVVRFSRENHKRMKELKKNVLNEKGKELSVNDLVGEMLSALETIKNGRMVYLVGKEVFDDVAEARGKAIMLATKNKEFVQMPDVAVIVGVDKI